MNEGLIRPQIFESWGVRSVEENVAAHSANFKIARLAGLTKDSRAHRRDDTSSERADCTR